MFCFILWTCNCWAAFSSDDNFLCFISILIRKFLFQVFIFLFKDFLCLTFLVYIMWKSVRTPMDLFMLSLLLVSKITKLQHYDYLLLRYVRCQWVLPFESSLVSNIHCLVFLKIHYAFSLRTIEHSVFKFLNLRNLPICTSLPHSVLCLWIYYSPPPSSWRLFTEGLRKLPLEA